MAFRPRRQPLPADRRLRRRAIALFIVFMLAVLSTWLDTRTVRQGAHYVARSSELMVLSQRLARDAQQALSGDSAAFVDLMQDRRSMDAILLRLDKGDPGLPPTSGQPRKVLDHLIIEARKTGLDIQTMETGRPGLVTVKTAIAATAAYSKQLDEVTQALIARLDGAAQRRAVRFALLVERIARTSGLMLGAVSAEQINALDQDVREADELLNGMPAGEPLVQKASDLFEGYFNAAKAIVGTAQGLLGAKRAGAAIVADSDGLLQRTRALISAYQAELANRHTDLIAVLSGIASLLLLMLLVRGYLEELRRRAREAERVNQCNQQAIQMLKQEIAGLADGDLTIKATVGDDITAAIAEVVNHITDELRDFVAGITEAASMLSHATAETRKTAQDLQAVARKQVTQLRQADTAVEQIASAAQQVDSSAFQSGQVARRTLEATARGAQAVHNTAAGMEGIRGQIQETAKRIKRLGESSQEIGESVDLIADLTEQTNVLAVNAAIQAAAAGESGRGFSLVAEEVQRLAERSAEATRQIGMLVTTIQDDTREAVAAMEKTTQDVVTGANLSHAAGQALQEIEQVSHELATLIDNISNATQTQTEMANKAAAAMAGILRLTEQNTEGAEQTTAALTALADLAVELRASVAGFKL